MTDTKLLLDAIRTIPDYPKSGILFRDVTTLLADARAFDHAVERLAAHFAHGGATKVAGLEARGFIFGGAVARALGVGFVPMRKRGKLPSATVRARYALEYGEDELEVHVDAFAKGEGVLVVDDLIATGGTAAAAIELVHRLGAHAVGAAFVIDLPDLGGARRIEALGVPVHALVSFSGH